jgi:hypothetical protein
MLFFHHAALRLLALTTCCTPVVLAGRFDGKYFSGSYSASAAGNVSYLELLDTARRMLSPADARFQTITGVLDASQNALTEGSQWSGNLWTQNTYGLGLAGAPFLSPAQQRWLQTSYLWWFDHRGDGGQFYGGLPDVPDGMLCDNGSPTGCNYMQCGPGRNAVLVPRAGRDSLNASLRHAERKEDQSEANNASSKQRGGHRAVLGDTAALGHDFIIEGTLAGSIMQAEMLLTTRNASGARLYLLVRGGRPISFFLLPASFFLLPSSFFLLPSSFFLLPSSPLCPFCLSCFFLSLCLVGLTPPAAPAGLV